MHSAALGFVARSMFDQPWRRAIAATFGGVDPPLSPRRAVVELGSLDINGSVRQIFTGAHYIGVDRQKGAGVDVVADAADYEPPWTPDTVVCCEVLEHAENAGAIIANAYKMLAPNGMLIVTCATDPRAEHSAVDGGELRADEYYHNVSADELLDWLEPFDSVITDTDNPGDLYALAFKAPEEEPGNG